MKIDDLLESLENSRRYFLKHVDGMPEEAWTWKPYPECMSPLETLAHLQVDDLTAIESLRTGKEPEYEKTSEQVYPEISLGRAHLLTKLAESRAHLVAELRSRFATADMDEPMCVWGSTMPLGRGVLHYCSEDFYHAGQVAFIRMAVDSGWNYYRDIYGIVGTVG